MDLKQDRVIAYIDGFNLYFGMLESGIEKGKWLNVEAMITSLLKPNQTLVGVKYFTSRVSGNPNKEKRQRSYLDALKTTSVELIYGHYQTNTQTCKSCGHLWTDQKEKKTDVNIASHLLINAFQNDFDTAILISGDSDLIPPVDYINKNIKDKLVAVFFPPSRLNKSLQKVAKGSLVLGRKKILDHQFPEAVTLKSGFVLEKPKEWK